MSGVDKPNMEHLLYRLDADVCHYNGALPERVAIAWRGYFAGLLEWALISVPEHDVFLSKLPLIEDDPVNDIMDGRH